MKFSTKIWALYICIYLCVIIIIGYTVTNNSYEQLKQQEITRSVDEEQNISSNVLLYLINNQQMNKETDLTSYGASIVDLFSSNNSYLEVFGQELQLIATNSPVVWNQERSELQVASTGQTSIILRHDEQGDYYLFVCSNLELEGKSLILCMVKDITYIEAHRQEQYKFFWQVGLIGLVVVGFVVAVLSYVLIKPIRDLNQAAQNIAAGNYTERVMVKSNDEVGTLAQQFNIMADEVENKVEQLQQESVRQQRFVDNLTHEFRTPLTSIIGYADLLKKIDYHPEVFHKGLSYIHSEGRRMLSLNKMMMDLTFYREEHFVLMPNDVLPVCHEVQEIIAVRAAEKEIEIVVKGEDFMLPMEKDLLKSLLINLIDNAIKASTAGAQIFIGTEETKEGKIIYVQDFGHGMEKSELERIKEPFYRVDKARSRQDGGVGLGVAICNQIAESLNGTLHYESEKGKGTKAYILFSQQ